MAQVHVRVAIGDVPVGWTAFDEAAGDSELFQCAEMAIEDPALLYYTSGSSGNPKGVLHAARSLYAWRLSAAWWQTLEEDDVKWCTSDTGWAKAGTGILFGPWSRGSCVLFHDGKFDVNQRLRLLAKHRVTVFCAPATEFRHLVSAPVAEHDLSALRLSVSAGESVNPEIVRRWHELTGAQLLDGYGQTETLMTVLNYPCMPVKPGSMGKPIPGTRFDILGEDSRVLGADEEGQLAMRLPNPQFMLGYWNNPERTRENIRRIAETDYWLTGDLAVRDADGYLFYTGRTDDIISSAGYRIGPTEVENALIEHPSVVESAVVAKPDHERGEIVKAFVVLRHGVVASDQLVEELQKHVQRVTAPYKYPRQIAFVETLPKNASGKLLRRVLRDQEYAAQAAQGAPP
jgi:acyl-coenzyme A synthetase/AMP-(fatty) acid ligase